jgi:hypothetical protein
VASRSEILEQQKKKRIGVLANWQDGEPPKYQFAGAAGLTPRDPDIQRGGYTPPSGPASVQRGPLNPSQQQGPAQVARVGQGTLLGRVGAAIGPMLASPMQQPRTSPRPEVPEQATAAASPQTSEGPNQNDIRSTILQKRRAQEINSRYQALGMTPAQGPGGQINMERADALRSMRNERDDILGSMAPIQQPQTVEQVQASRTNIREQGMGQVAVMRKRAFEADKAGDAATAQKLYDEARRMEVAFRSSFPDHSPEAAQEIVGRQEQGAERAANQRGAYGEIAAAQGNDGESLMKQKIQARERQAKIDQMLQSRDESMIGGDIRENQMRGRVSPQDRLAEAEGNLRVKQLDQATAGGGKANSVAAGVRSESRAAALSMVGLDTPEAQSSFMSRAMELGGAIRGSFRKGMATPSARGELDQYLTQFEGTVMETLEELASLDPDAAREYASGVLNQIPQVPRFSAQSTEATGRLNVLRKRLSNMVSPETGSAS